MTTPPKEEARPVEVTQADREAAANLEYAIGDKGYSHALRSGKLNGIDSDVRVQAFARHRLATLPPQHSSGDARELVDRLRRTMQHKGLSARDVAPEIGLGFSTVARALRGEGVLPRTQGKISRWLRKNEVPTTLGSDIKGALETALPMLRDLANGITRHYGDRQRQAQELVSAIEAALSRQDRKASDSATDREIDNARGWGGNGTGVEVDNG